MCYLKACHTSNGSTWRTTVEWYWQSKTPDSSTRALWLSYYESRLIAKQEELEKEMNFALRNIFSYFEGFFNMPKIVHMVTPPLFLLRRKEYCEVLSPLEINSPWSSLNPRTLGPMASTLTARPPGSTTIGKKCLFIQIQMQIILWRGTQYCHVSVQNYYSLRIHFLCG
jgi:hypothetical protein